MTVYVKDYDGETVRKINNMGISFQNQEATFGFEITIMLAFILSPLPIVEREKMIKEIIRKKINDILSKNHPVMNGQTKKLFFEKLYNMANSEKMRQIIKELAGEFNISSFDQSPFFPLIWQEGMEEECLKDIKKCRSVVWLTACYQADLPDKIKTGILRRITWLESPDFN